MPEVLTSCFAALSCSLPRRARAFSANLLSVGACNYWRPGSQSSAIWAHAWWIIGRAWLTLGGRRQQVSRAEAEEDFYVGTRRDVLRRVEGGWKIARRRMVLDQAVLTAKNLSIFF